ncbi:MULTISPECIES: M16 family metallopeptidase [Sphingobacterium]|uniref:M16 family metallopeptidase n=1 Tax=Sphingobacterium populi TaxID=1812824 RepID=A0ABW5UG39_9SPHI|nr:pitrilysin family protein [Sphingobacterium sp. CFCC 11742]
MVNYNKFVLANGLRVLVHEDHTTPMACVNVLYDVGARDEDPKRTGFAHLFEHLMFGGSVNIPNYDEVLQRVGGENNAFTSNDITNYYITLPAVNLETALWLESDRMLSLAFNEQSLEVQRQVVIEEFKQRYLNQPYGDVWLKLRPLAYQQHPYRWATIGKNIEHIEQATMAEVKDFFDTFYHPSNAVLVVAGDVKFDEVQSLVDKWFADIPDRPVKKRSLPQELPQQVARRETVEADVPVDSIYIAFHGPDRHSTDYYTLDLISDILSRGNSSRLYRTLVKEQQLFAEVNAYLMGSTDTNLFVVEGKPSEGISLEVAEQALWKELERLKMELANEKELDKVKNKVESTMFFSELSVLDKAMNLAYFELLGDANAYNTEVDKYARTTTEDVRQVASSVFRTDNSSTLLYKAKRQEAHVE